MWWSQAVLAPHPNHTIVRNADDLQHMVNWMRAFPERILDFETDGLLYADGDKPIGIAMGVIEDLPGGDYQHRAWYVPVAHQVPEQQISEDVAKLAVKDAFADAKAMIGHNFKFDLNMARANGYILPEDCDIHDTMVGAHLVYEKRSMQLEKLAASVPGASPFADAFEAKNEISNFLAKRAQQRRLKLSKGEYKNPSYLEIYGHSEVPIALEGEYACRDIGNTGYLDRVQRPEAMGIGTPYEDQARYLYWHEMQLVRALAEMEYNGQHVDEQYLVQFAGEIDDEMSRMAIQLSRKLNTTMDFGSDTAVRSLLYEHLKLPIIKLTDKGSQLEKEGVRINKMDFASVDRSTLIMLGRAHPKYAEALDLLGEYKARQKVRSTYTLSLAHKICKDGKIHPSFLSHGTGTGRLSSRDPNWQNVPSRHKILATKIRNGVYVPEGHTRLYADYSQVELRALAWITGVPTLNKAYASDAYRRLLYEGGGPENRAWYDWYVEARKLEEAVDAHGATAIEVLGADPEAPDWKKKRGSAKVINFGVAYGMSEVGLQQNPQLMLSPEEALDFYNRYHAHNPEIAECQARLFRSMLSRRGTPKFVNWVGRTVHGPALRSSDRQVVSSAQRSLFASLVQGTAAELTKMSILRWYKAYKAGDISYKLTSTVHDEIQGDGPTEELEWNAREIRWHMENYRWGDVPIIADLERSETTWAEKRDYKP